MGGGRNTELLINNQTESFAVRSWDLCWGYVISQKVELEDKKHTFHEITASIQQHAIASVVSVPGWICTAVSIILILGEQQGKHEKRHRRRCPRTLVRIRT